MQTLVEAAIREEEILSRLALASSANPQLMRWNRAPGAGVYHGPVEYHVVAFSPRGEPKGTYAAGMWPFIPRPYSTNIAPQNDREPRSWTDTDHLAPVAHLPVPAHK